MEERVVDLDNIFPFTTDMIHLLSTVRGMKKIVEDNVDRLNITLRDHVKDIVHEYLTENQIDIQLIQRMNSIVSEEMAFL